MPYQAQSHSETFRPEPIRLPVFDSLSFDNLKENQGILIPIPYLQQADSVATQDPTDKEHIAHLNIPTQ